MTECVADADINIPEEIHSLAEHEFSKESLKYDLPKHEISESSDTIVAEEDDIIEVQAEDTMYYMMVIYITGARTDLRKKSFLLRISKYLQDL